MLNIIDDYLLKSGMPKDELCVIGRAKRAFYYYGMAVMGVTGLVFAVLGLVKIIN